MHLGGIPGIFSCLYYTSGVRSVKPVHVLIQSTVAQLHYTDICLSSCLLERSVEITGSIEGRREGGDECWKTQREKEKDKESDIRGLRVWSLQVGLGWHPKAESRIGSVPAHTEDPHVQKIYTHSIWTFPKTYWWKTELWKYKSHCPGSSCTSWIHMSQDSPPIPPRHWKH